MVEQPLTHLDPLGRARMSGPMVLQAVCAGPTAGGRVLMSAETTALIARGEVSKGDVLAVARVAGIQAAKRTSDLIPLCHPVGIGGILINFRIDDAWVEVEARVETVDRTGVEMEALTAVSVACLTIYDMCKSVDRAMTLGEITLWEKTGGRSGAYRRQGDEVGEGRDGPGSSGSAIFDR